jgi:hypothetical protein
MCKILLLRMKKYNMEIIPGSMAQSYELRNKALFRNHFLMDLDNVEICWCEGMKLTSI